ncbi:hypothetical protein [Methanosarcina barkeri]|uniref:hypothetical protein n=1 Tax=Methanosarcina barkeri TaxID=2208 RepID=UPI000A515A37
MKFNNNKLYKIIFIGILIAALVVTSGCADKSTSDTNQNGSSPSETSGVSDADKAAESGEFTLTDGYVGKLLYLKMWNRLFAQELDACAILYTCRPRMM